MTNHNDMTRYVAFLRGINVGGARLIKMADLRDACTSLGFKNVKTYIQSGNVVFDSPETDPDLSGLAKKIENKIRKSFGHEVPVALQTLDDLKAILKRNPFKRIQPSAEVMMFVTFLVAEPGGKPELPLRSLTENLDVFQIKDRVAFILSRRKKNGWFGFPNNFVEQKLGVLATTRNWSTVRKIVDFAATE